MEVLLFITFFLAALIFFIVGKDDFGRKPIKVKKDKVESKSEDKENVDNKEEKKEDKLESESEDKENVDNKEDNK